MKAICIECLFLKKLRRQYKKDFFNFECNCLEAPITDFLKGRRQCHNLNWNGECKYFISKEVEK